MSEITMMWKIKLSSTFSNFLTKKTDFEISGVDWVFDPSIIRSFFNHVFFVIRKDHAESKARGTTMYRIAVTYKNGVQDFGPAIPASSLIEKSQAGRELLLTKRKFY